jgi:para-aminobenzoate synthetase/4-amino-4-deoxychorismate lyase
MTVASAPLRFGETFVLFDNAGSEGGSCRLYRRPRAILETASLEELSDLLEQIRDLVREGAHVAGFLTYEAGAAMNPKVPERAIDRLAWFGVFDQVDVIYPDEVGALLPSPEGACVSRLRPYVTRDDYTDSVERVLELIRAGDLYQANLTFRASLDVAGDPLSLYACLRSRQRAAHCAIVATGGETLLSFSPELFFSLSAGRITCRPMKGTARCPDDPGSFEAVAQALAADPKQQAENLMIVDLMRNDLSKLARVGSVEVPQLFAVERYPTVFQMVSSVTAVAREDVDAVTVLETLHPCGSITGAPKIRAMQVIHEVEAGSRDAYTGSIGWMSPGGDAQFNVAIRTLTVAESGASATFGVGSGIVADSRASDEWQECLDKASFLQAAQPQFSLVETMRFEPEVLISERERHLARLERSARTLGFVCDLGGIEAALDAATSRLTEATKLRLILSFNGAFALELATIPLVPRTTVSLMITERSVSSLDVRLQHKTTDRTPYQWPAGSEEMFDVLFVDEAGFLTEGSFTNIFLRREGRLVTPPLHRGLLPGILRETLIERGEVVEGDIHIEDCAGDLFVGNAIRGLIRGRIFKP